MPGIRTVKNYFNFTKGFITEASPLTFPPNTCIDINNFDLYHSGLIARRRGLTAEDQFQLLPEGGFPESIVENGGISAAVWTSVNELGDLNFLTVQIGKTLYFHDMTVPGALSRNVLSSSVDMTPYVSVASADPGKYQVTAASIMGVQYVTSPILNLFYNQYDDTTGDVTAATATPQIRDLVGLDDGLAPDENPTTLSPEHNYNLLNQGWTALTIQLYFAQFKNYPSNSQVWWESKDADGAFDPAGMADIQFGTGLAAKGHFILDLYNQDRSAASGIPGLPVTTIFTRPTGIVSWLGRLFIGVEDTVYFSKIIQTPNDAYQFYQQADPASEVDPALVASDGGVIKISNCGKINALVVTQTGLVIGASNGVWVITAFSGYEFNATSYRVIFVADVGVGGQNNMYAIEGNVLIVSDGGIYRLGTSDRGNPELQNLTENTIQTFYLNIPRSARAGSTLFYDQTAKKAYMYYDADADEREGLFRNQYDSVLILDLTLGAWSKYSIAQPAQYDTGIYDAFLLNVPQIIGLELDVVDSNNELVVDSMGEAVYELDEIPLINETDVGYLIVSGQNGTYNYTFGNFSQLHFYDWDYLEAGATSYDSTLLTGFEMLDDVTRRKCVPYIWMHFERTETTFLEDDAGNLVLDFPSSLFCEAVWEWANDYSFFRRSNPQQLYRLKYFVPGVPGQPFEYPFDTIQTKTSLRGRGKCVSLYLYSEEGKDARIYGWAMELQAKGSPS